MPDRFDDPQYWVEVFENPDRDRWQMPTHVVSLMEIEPGMVVADIGAGTGYFEPYLGVSVGDSGRVLALDIEPNLVAFMGTREDQPGWGPVEPRLIASDDPGLEPQSADRILIVNTWHHVADRPAYALLLRDALAPTGALFIVDFNIDSDMGPPAEHKLAAETVVDELEEAGFEAQILDAELPEQYIVVARVSP